MRPPSRWRIFLSELTGDRELYGSLLVAALLLIGELAAPLHWQQYFKLGALAVLGLGLTLSLFRHYRAARLLHDDKPIPIVVALQTPRREALKSLEAAKEAITRTTGFDAFGRVESFFNVHYEDLLLQRPDRLAPDPAAWAAFLADVQREVTQFQQHLPGDQIYHVFIQGPASLALAVGVLLGSKNRVAAYQHVDGQYRPVLNLAKDSRRLKERLASPGYRYVTVERPPALAAEIALALDLASHAASGPASAYLTQHSMPLPLVKVVNTYGGNLAEADWVPVAQEVYQVFLELLQNPQIRRIHLFHSMPVALGVGIGLALGHFAPVTVYNWEPTERTYYSVLDLNRLEGRL